MQKGLEILDKEHLVSSDIQLHDLRDALISLQREHAKLSWAFQLISNDIDHENQSFKDKVRQFGRQYEQLDQHSIEFLHHVEALTRRVAGVTKEA